MATSKIIEEKTKECDNEDENDIVEVVIIGAGVAGLSAARSLLLGGINNVKILEARNRIGGRVCGIEFAGNHLEMGANWIHGVLGNPIYELALSKKLVDINHQPKPHSVVATTEGGKRVPFSILQEIYDAYSWFLKRCEEYFYSKDLYPPEGVESVGEHIELEISIYLEQFSEEEQYIRRLLFDSLLNRETCISGCHSMDEIDLVDIGSYVELPGGNLVLKEGYSSILPTLEEGIPGDCILKKHPVSLIKWKSDDSKTEDYESDSSEKTIVDEPTVKSSPEKDDINSSHPSGSNLVEVHCENGKVYKCHHVICTIPLGVMKANIDTLFRPSLPEHKVDSVKRLLFGVVDKIYLVYDRPFIHPKISEIIILWDRNSECHDPLKDWFKKIYSFTKVTETVLLAWVSGKEAEVLETLDSSTIAHKCTEILRSFLGDPCVPEPSQIACSSWYSQPYTKGSYTAISVDSSQSDIENLAQPLFMNPYDSKPVLLFAGEHTHPSFYSTVHGAYLSGQSAAKHLLVSESPCSSSRGELDAREDTDLNAWIQGLNLNGTVVQQ